jgi:sugar diacid utilization regulator
MKPLLQNNLQDNNEIRFISIGEIRTELDHLRYSYENAQDLLHIQKILGEPAISFFEDLGVYTIIHGLDKSGELDNFIRQTFKPGSRYNSRKKANCY